MKQFQFKTFDEQKIARLRKALDRELSRHGLAQCSHIVESILSELIQNAIKANLKRIFFENQKTEPDDEAISRFHNELMENPAGLMQRAARSKLIVRVQIESGRKLIVRIFNSAPMTRGEIARVQRALAGKRNSAEGAGLGLGMCASLLAGIGLPDALRFESNVRGTEFRLTLPKGIASPDQGVRLLPAISAALPLPILSDTRAKLRAGIPPAEILATEPADPVLVLSVKSGISPLRLKSAPMDLEPLARSVQPGSWAGLEQYFAAAISKASLKNLQKKTGRKPGKASGLHSIGVNPEALRALILRAYRSRPGRIK